MYARGVSLTFRGEPKFSTWTGTVLTFFTIMLLTIFTAICTLKLVSREDPFLSANTLPRKDDHRVDLVALDYAFAVTQVDPKLGRVSIVHVQWPKGGDKIITPFEVVDCDELWETQGDKLSKSWQVLL